MIKLYTDAGLNTNLNLGVVAYVIKDNNNTYKNSLQENSTDNHYLEFLALKLALNEIIERRLNNDLLFLHSDSQIVIDSLNKNYSKHYQPILDQILELLDQFPEYFAKHIADKDNGAAHALVHQEMLHLRKHGYK